MLYRITAYNEKENISVIMDSNGKFEKIVDFSIYMYQKSFNTVEISESDTFLDGNIKPPKSFPNHVILRACQYGKPQATTFEQNGITYKAIQVNRKIYVPNKNKHL